MRQRIERQLVDSIEGDERKAVPEESEVKPEQIAGRVTGEQRVALLSMERPTGIKARAPSKAKYKPPEMSWPDYLIMLLHTGAEIEHCLMVQYLYAAYSLGGERVPLQHRERVRQWRESILTIAREEMGHLLCIQNGLMLVGGPISLERSDFPAPSIYPYPFAFRLEPLSLESLSAYVKAEMPPADQLERLMTVQPRRYGRFVPSDLKRIEEALKQRPGDEHRVGDIYDVIQDIVKRRHRLKDSDLHPETYGLQASWDEWGRGYQLDRPQPDGHGMPDLQGAAARKNGKPREGRVLVERIATRSQALAVLADVAGQGEAPHFQPDRNQQADRDEGPSHFDRFYRIYRDYFEHVTNAPEPWSPTREVPNNPTTLKSFGRQEELYVADGQSDLDESSFGEWQKWADFAKPTWIASRRSRLWANLFNLRYRMLLTYLAHTYRLPRVNDGGAPGVRNATLHRVFAEMYNLKAIAGILVQLPLDDDPSSTKHAGPPFEMPYTLELPLADLECWELHMDLLESSRQLCKKLIYTSRSADGGQYVEYLETLLQLDRQSIKWIGSVHRGMRTRNRT